MITDDNRPLTKNKEDLQKLLEERYDIYDRYCDCKIANNGAVDDAVKEIIAVFRGEQL